MAPPIRKTRFVPEWIDMGPKIPVPRVDWIEDKLLDVAYGEHPLQKYDIYYPKEKKDKYPVLILVHGGGFMVCDKRDWHVYPGFHALQQGFALVSVNYRMAPEFSFPAPVEDLKTTVSELRQRAGELRLDPDNFFLYGTSAGGNLVTYVGLDGPASRGTERDYHVNAVADLCGIINFTQCLDQMPRVYSLLPPVRKIFNTYVGGMPKKAPQKAQAASADSRITAEAPPFYIQHGDKDPAVPLQQSVNLYNRLRAAGGENAEKHVLDVLKGAPHAGAGPEYLEIGNVQPILDFFVANMR